MIDIGVALTARRQRFRVDASESAVPLRPKIKRLLAEVLCLRLGRLLQDRSCFPNRPQ